MAKNKIQSSDSKQLHPRRRIGVETLMLMAKYDNEFRELLMADRRRALDESGIEFSPSERMIIEAIGREQLEKNIESFNLPGVTKKNLPNWRAAASVMVLVSTILFGTDACTHQEPLSEKIKEQKCISPGCWIDDDTFRVNALGSPWGKATGKEERRKASKRAAILNAQYQMIEQFRGNRIEGATGIMTADPSGIEIVKFLKQVIKGGKVIGEEYDNEDKCMILFEIKEKGLKKMVWTAEWDY